MWGWEPEQRTRYVYDDTGRLVESVTTREPEYDATDRQLFLALDEWESALCPGCNQPLAETTDGAHEFDWTHGERMRCYACQAQATWVETQQLDKASPVDRASVMFTPPRPRADAPVTAEPADG